MGIDNPGPVVLIFPKDNVLSQRRTFILHAPKRKVHDVCAEYCINTYEVQLSS